MLKDNYSRIRTKRKANKKHKNQKIKLKGKPQNHQKSMQRQKYINEIKTMIKKFLKSLNRVNSNKKINNHSNREKEKIKIQNQLQNK